MVVDIGWKHAGHLEAARFLGIFRIHVPSHFLLTQIHARPTGFPVLASIMQDHTARGMALHDGGRPVAFLSAVLSRLFPLTVVSSIDAPHTTPIMTTFIHGLQDSLFGLPQTKLS